MIERIIKCGVKNCGNKHKEEGFNKGFPGWGNITGIYNNKTGEEGAHLCPKCLSKIKHILNGENNDLG